MNEEFEANELGLPDKAPKKTPAQKAAATRKANAAKKAAAEEVVEAKGSIQAETAFIDPEMDRENWPTIMIEMEEGKPNYEFVTSHGTMKDGKPFGHELQIMRGVEVQVAPSVVESLRCTVSTHFVPRRDPVTNRLMLDRQDRSSVPWKLVKAGKYFE